MWNLWLYDKVLHWKLKYQFTPVVNLETLKNCGILIQFKYYIDNKLLIKYYNSNNVKVRKTVNLKL